MADYTEHYQLHQWQPQDPFLRTDFNEDLQKIDTALNKLGQEVESKATQTALTAEQAARQAMDARLTALEGKQGLHLIRTISPSTATPYFTADLSGINWTQWKRVYLLFSPVQSTDNIFEVMLNSDMNYRFQTSESTSFAIDFLPLYGLNPCVSFTLLAGNNPKVWRYPLAWSGITTLFFRCTASNRQFTTATKLELYGEY